MENIKESAMNAVNDFFKTVQSVFASFEWNDLLDILIVSFLLYKLIQIIRETRAAQLFKGLVLILVLTLLTGQLNLKTIQLLLSGEYTWGVLAVVIIFQPELRRVLEKAGRTKVSNFGVFAQFDKDVMHTAWIRAIDVITAAAKNLSDTKTGALIVIERQTKLGEQISTGVQLNADISVELLENIFFHNSPLHDGAVIIRDAKILAASCFLPKPNKEEFISRELGARHRAAIGMSENSDALIIIVSEETGVISVAENSELSRNFNQRSLVAHLREKILSESAESKKEKKSALRKNKKSE